MELQELIGQCENLKGFVLQQYHSQKERKDPDRVYKALEMFLPRLHECVDKTLEISDVKKYNMWWSCLWDISSMDPNVNKRLFQKFRNAVQNRISYGTITWKLKYDLLTMVYLSKHNPQFAFNYLAQLIIRIKSATKFPMQMVYYQALLTFFDEHRLKYEEQLIRIIRCEFSDFSGINIIDPNLVPADVDAHTRTVLNGINRHSWPSVIIYSILCHQVHLQGNILLISPLKSGEFWVDFNLNDKTVTLNCESSCLSNDRTITDSQEVEQRTTEILSIEFESITNIVEKDWGVPQNPKGTLLIFTLIRPCSYIYRSSRTMAQGALQLFLNIERSDDLNRLLHELAAIFTDRYTILKKNHRQHRALGSQASTNSTADSKQLRSPCSGRTASRTALSSLGLSHVEENDSCSSQVSVAYKETMRLQRSGSTLRQIHQIQTEIQTPVLNDRHSSFRNGLNSDNRPVSNTSDNRILPLNQNPNRSRLSLLPDNDKDESISENSQINNSRTITPIEEKMNRTMDKYNPQPYKAHPSTSLQRLSFDSFTSNKENEPENIPQGRSSAVNSPGQRRSRQGQGALIDTIDLVSSDSDDNTTSVATNKPNNNSPPQVSDRLNRFIVQSDDENESDRSVILAGNLRNRTKFNDLLLKKSALQQGSQDSAVDFQQQIMTAKRKSTGPSKRARESLAKEQSQINRYVPKKSVMQQESQDSTMDFQQQIITPKRKSADSSKTLHELISKLQSQISQKTVSSQNTPIDVIHDSSSVDFQPRVAKRSCPNENSEKKTPNQKPKLDNTCHSPSPKAPSEIYDLNNTADVILGRVLSNAELSKCQASNVAVTPTSQHCNILSVNATLQTTNSGVTDGQASAPTSQALLHSSAECGAASHRPLDVVTPLSDMSIRSARSYVSVTPSSQQSYNINTSNEYHVQQFTRHPDTEFDKIRYDYPTPPSNIYDEGSDDDDDHSDELIIDLDHDPDSLNDANETVETTNTTVDVQQAAGVRRKRGRPRRTYTSETDGNETVNTTARSTASGKRRSRRQKKRKKKYDYDTELIDDLNYSLRTNEKLTDAEREEEERRYILRFKTRTRVTNPPTRLVDELNKSYLEQVHGEIQRKREGGMCIDTVLYRKRVKPRARRTDTADPPRLSQTLNALDITEYLNDTEFECDIPERGAQSDVEHRSKQRKKKKNKKNKGSRIEYDSSLIEDISSIRLRLSRRNESTCEMLTEESGTEDATQSFLSQSLESQGWGAVFNKTTAPSHLQCPEKICNNTNRTDVCDYLKKDLAMYKKINKAIDRFPERKIEEQKALTNLHYKEVEQIREKLKQYAHFLQEH